MSVGVTLNRHMAKEARRALRRARIVHVHVCEQCGADHGDIHGHHDDYAKPLELRWLCRSCHIRLHIARGEWKTRLGSRFTRRARPA